MPHDPTGEPPPEGEDEDDEEVDDFWEHRRYASRWRPPVEDEDV